MLLLAVVFVVVVLLLLLFLLLLLRVRWVADIILVSLFVHHPSGVRVDSAESDRGHFEDGSLFEDPVRPIV